MSNNKMQYTIAKIQDGKKPWYSMFFPAVLVFILIAGALYLLLYDGAFRENPFGNEPNMPLNNPAFPETSKSDALPSSDTDKGLCLEEYLDSDLNEAASRQRQHARLP